MEDPPVFLDYDQAALDEAYDQAAYAPNRKQLIKRRIRDSQLARRRIGEPERVADGSAPVYGWFTEGFDTADLKEAKTLLGELTEPAIAAEGE
jgi:predicted ATPase